jgi:hypoxanthine phosphoribosyltransferase
MPPAVLISEEAIAQRVRELAARISADYATTGEVLLVGVLRGAFIFLADLSRRLTVPRRVDFIALSAYQGAGTAPGAVRLLMDLRTNVAGRHVLVVEDIVDTGHTLRYLLDTLQTRQPASLRTCALVRKPARREVEVPVDYLGFDIPDRWVVGYGLDYNDQWRTLPYIGVIERKEGENATSSEQ